MHSPWVFGNQRKVLLWGNDISSTWVLLEMYILVSQAPAVEAQVIPTMLTIWETWMWRTLDLKSVDSVALMACVWCLESGETSKAQCYTDFSPERKEASRVRTTRHPAPPLAASYYRVVLDLTGGRKEPEELPEGRWPCSRLENGCFIYEVVGERTSQEEITTAETVHGVSLCMDSRTHSWSTGPMLRNNAKSH